MEEVKPTGEMSIEELKTAIQSEEETCKKYSGNLQKSAELMKAMENLQKYRAALRRKTIVKNETD